MSQDTSASQGPRRLDQLPLEVLRQVAVRGPFTSTLSLLQVNHTLRSACNDWTVFRDIITNNSNSSTRTPTWQVTTLHLPSDPHTFWARYALADLKAAQFLDDPEKPSPRQISQWLPQIMAMCHPISSSLPITELSANIEISEAEEAAVLGFCRAACSLSRQCDLDSDADRAALYASIVGHDPNIQLDLTSLDLYLPVLPFLAINGGWPRIHSPSSSVSDLFPLAYKAVSLIYHELLQEFQDLNIPGFGTVDPHILPVAPTAFDIPFSTFMALPLPFCLGCADAFNTCHLKVMATIEFLESGTWSGCTYIAADPPFPTRPWFDRPFYQIQFTVTTRNKVTKVIEFHSDGLVHDVMGPFQFEGLLEVDSGKIDLTKRYDPRQLDTPHQAILTPFGIIASFGEESRPGHWMWLWKTSWTADKSAGQVDVP